VKRVRPVLADARLRGDMRGLLSPPSQKVDGRCATLEPLLAQSPSASRFTARTSRVLRLKPIGSNEATPAVSASEQTSPSMMQEKFVSLIE
jgi:hypothetical protein